MHLIVIKLPISELDLELLRKIYTDDQLVALVVSAAEAELKELLADEKAAQSQHDEAASLSPVRGLRRVRSA